MNNSRKGKNIECEVCGTFKYFYPCQVKTARFCSRKCQGIAQIGNPSGIKDKKWSVESKKRLSTSLTGRKISKKGCENIRNAKLGEKNPNYGITPSKETINKRNDTIREKYDRIGRKTTLNHALRTTSLYKEWRLMVFGRDNFTCQECGCRGIYLEAHHKISLSDIIEKHGIKNMGVAINCEEIWNIDNGITYCKKCHCKNDSIRARFITADALDGD